MDLTEIHFHDSVIRAVIENTAIDELRFDVEYPVNWNENEFSQAFIVFSDVRGYEVHEIAFEGSPTILDVEVLSRSHERNEIKIITNASFRSFSYDNVNIEWPNKYKNLLEEHLYSEKRDAWVRFVLNDNVKINSGEHAGSSGSVVSNITQQPDIKYLL